MGFFEIFVEYFVLLDELVHVKLDIFVLCGDLAVVAIVEGEADVFDSAWREEGRLVFGGHPAGVGQ